MTVPPERRFATDDAIDAQCEARFGVIRDTILATNAAAWRTDPRTLLAAIIALDQFSRNIHRGSPRAFEADGLALTLAREAIGQGWDRGLSIAERQFLYMPFQHAEDAAVQAESVALFATLGDADGADFARMHQEVIARFGRFPSRNAALGRTSTAEEHAWLESDAAKF